MTTYYKRYLPQFFVLVLGLSSFSFLFPTKNNAWLMVFPVLGLLFIGKKWIKNSLLSLPLLCLAVSVLVNCFFSVDRAASLPKWSGVVFGLLVFFCVTILVQNLFSFYWALGIFLFLTVFVAGFGLFFTDWFEHKFIFLNPITTQLSQIRLFLPSLPSVLHPNEVAGTLLWGLPILVVLPFARWNFKSRWQCVLFVVANSILLLLVLFSFLLMQSRAGYLALLLTFVLMVVLAIGTYRVYGVRIKLFFLSAFVAIGLGSLVFWKQLLPLFEKMMSYFPFEASSINRMEIWSSAMYAIKDFPLTGMGMNTFRSVAPFMYPLFVNLDYDIAHAHNEFLHVAVDLGLLGLIAFVSIYILAFYMLFQLFNHSIQNPHDTFPLKAVVFGLGGGLFAHLLWGMVDAIALGAKPGFLFWMLLGLISALYTIYQDKDKKLKELNHAG